jgi:hypothetical protein
VAAKRDTSIPALLTRALERIADGKGYADARRGMLNDLRKGYELGTHGKTRWTRDSVHDR